MDHLTSTWDGNHLSVDRRGLAAGGLERCAGLLPSWLLADLTPAVVIRGASLTEGRFEPFSTPNLHLFITWPGRFIGPGWAGSLQGSLAPQSEPGHRSRFLVKPAKLGSARERDEVLHA
jgi:hypothetical protein